MNRRGFIGRMVAAVTAVAVSTTAVAVERRPGLREARIAGSDAAHGIGFAPIKREGASIPYDQLDLKPGRIWQSRDENEEA